MMNNKTTKRALFSSIMALVLCFAMLVGTTFAWFTDTEVSGSNVIKAGNLDIEVQYTLDGETWADLDGADDLFQKGLWEPGHTEVVGLKIENKGTLALKYKAYTNIVDETIGKTKAGKDIVLSEILTVSTVTQQADMIGEALMNLIFNGGQNTDTTAPKSFKSGNIFECDQELAPGAAHYLIVVVDMAETVGNEANHDGTHIPEIDFGLNVVATQYTQEYDTFSNQYDAPAVYPVLTADDFVAAVKAGGHVIMGADIKLTRAEAIPVANDVFIDMSGYDLDCSANTSRPFQIVDGAEMTIKAYDSDIVCGTYGLVRMDEAGHVTINGGNFTGELPNAGFIRVSGSEAQSITLNDVTVKATATDSRIIGGEIDDVTLNVNGGTFEAGMGFIASKGTINGATITTKSPKNMMPAVYAAGDMLVKNCTINAAYNALAVDGGNTLTVENCTVNAPADKLAFQVFSSGGTIDVKNTTYTGGMGCTGNPNTGCVAIVNIDGVEAYRKAHHT